MSSLSPEGIDRILHAPHPKTPNLEIDRTKEGHLVCEKTRDRLFTGEISTKTRRFSGDSEERALGDSTENPPLLIALAHVLRD